MPYAKRNIVAPGTPPSYQISYAVIAEPPLCGAYHEIVIDTEVELVIVTVGGAGTEVRIARENVKESSEVIFPVVTAHILQL